MENKLNGLSVAELERLQFRAQCKVRCLDAQLERIPFSEFEEVMSQLEVAINEAETATLQLIQARRSAFTN